MRVSVAYVLLALSGAGLVAGNLSGLEHKQRARSFGRELKRASGNSDALRAVERAPLLDVFGTDDSKDGKRGSILDGLLGDDSDSDDSSSSTTTHTSTTHSKTSSDDDTSTKSSTKTSDNEDKTTKTSSDDDKTTSTKTSSSDGERQATKTTSDDEPTSTNKGLLGDLVDGVGNLLNPDDDKSTSTTKTTAGPTPAPTANKTKSNDDDDSTSSKTKSSSKDSDEDNDDESTSTSSKDGGLLGGLTSALGGALSDVGGIFTGDGSSTKTSSDDDKSTKTKSKTDDDESTSTTSKGGLLDPILTPILGGGDDDTSTKTGTKTKTNDDESTSTTSKGGLLDPILTPIFGGGDDSSTKTGTKTKSNDDKPSSTSTGGLLDPILTPIFGTGTDEPTKTTTGTKPTQTNDNSDEDGSTTNKTGNSGQATRTQSNDSSQATETSGSTSNFDASNVRPTATHLLTDPNATATATESDDSSRSSDSDRSTDTETQTTGGYWYADKSSLILPSATSSSDSDDERHDSTKSADPQETNAQQFPATIVPADGALVQPTDTTSVAILLKPTMKWTWLASNSDTTAQVFAFLPAIMSQSVGLDPNDIVTVRLQSYYPTGQTKESDALSLYMAYVPSKSTEDLAAYVRNTSSLFYTGPTDNVAKQLAANVDPNFNILSVVGGQTRGGKAQHETQGNDDSSATLRNALIGVGSALVAVIVGFIGWRVWRKQRKADLAARRAAARPGRRGTIRSFGAGPLRETWAPSIAEQERVLHGQQLTQTWDNDADMQEHDDGPLRRSIIQPGSAGLETGWGDPFVDQWAVGNRSSVMTERSGGSGGLLSRASGLTEAQRIQQEYIDGHEDGVTPLSPTSALAMGGSYNEEYQIPQQYTSSHAYGPRASENQRHRKRTSRSSTASISRPELQSNSMLL